MEKQYNAVTYVRKFEVGEECRYIKSRPGFITLTLKYAIQMFSGLNEISLVMVHISIFFLHARCPSCLPPPPSSYHVFFLSL